MKYASCIWLTILGAIKEASTIRFWGGGPGDAVVALMTSVSPLGTSWQTPRNQDPIAVALALRLSYSLCRAYVPSVPLRADRHSVDWVVQECKPVGTQGAWATQKSS